MKSLIQPLLVMIMALTTATASAQEHSPASSVSDDAWLEYQAEYPRSPLCGEDEVTLWSCATGKRIYSLCSSRLLSRTSGYMQYRASRHGEVVFTYPLEKKPPAGSFSYTLFGNGDASVEFVNEGYVYTLFDPLRDGSFLFVSPPDSAEKGSLIKCPPNQTLQVNYTMALMYDSGVWEHDD